MTRVLIVDDEDLIIKSLTVGLRFLGYDVQATHSPAEAVRAARTEHFDVALVDYRMAPMDGVEVLCRLREAQPGCARILMSGDLDLAAVVNAVNGGQVARVLQKPFAIDEINRAIADLLVRGEASENNGDRSGAAARKKRYRMLEECLQGDTLQLALQPIVAASRGEVVAYEALLRSSHPLLSSPRAVLRVAEESEALAAVGERVVERAAAWLRRLPPETKLFMNVHPAELGDPSGVRQRLAPLLDEASRVVVEITERARVVEVQGWRQNVDWLRDNGFAIALDDLGAGYSSLSMLAELDPEYVKIDMSIVRGAHADGRKQRLIELLCRFADATRAQVVAEGVETQQEMDAMRACGVHLLQGFLLAKPTTHMDELLAFGQRPDACCC